MRLERHPSHDLQMGGLCHVQPLFVTRLLAQAVFRLV